MMGGVFLLAVVVAGDGPGPHVGPGPDVRIPQVGEMPGLHPFVQDRFFHFHEVADVHPCPQVA